MSFPEVAPALERLMRELLEQTKTGKIKWAETDQSDEYIFSAKSSSVLVGSKLDRDGDRNTAFVLINSKGAEAASLRSGFSPDPDGGYISDPINESLDELFFAAKANALDINNTLNDIYEALRGNGSE